MDKEEIGIAVTVPMVVKNPNGLLLKLKNNQREYYIRDTEWTTEVVYNGKCYLYTKNSSKIPNQYLWLFGEVKRQAENRLKEIQSGESDWKVQPMLPSSRINMDYDDEVGVITGTDLAMAYWTIAKNLKIIDNYLFEKFVGPQFKIIRLAALAVLGRNKTYVKTLPDGSQAKVVLDGNPELRSLYDSIRYNCFGHMQYLSEQLGPDFDCYKTDCIYYRDTKANRDMVSKYFAKNGFKFRQLVYDMEAEYQANKKK